MHDIRAIDGNSSVLEPDDYADSKSVGSSLRSLGSEGIVYPSVRLPDGECAALFHPNRGSHPTQGRHLDYHWNGAGVDLFRDARTGQVYRAVCPDFPAWCVNPENPDFSYLVALFGANLRAARLKLGFTQARPAEQSGLLQQYVSLVESGRQNVTLTTGRT